MKNNLYSHKEKTLVTDRRKFLIRALDKEKKWGRVDNIEVVDIVRK